MTRRFNQLTILALLLLFTFCELYLIRESIGCTVGALLPVWIVLICLSTWFTTCSPRGLWIGLPLSALLLFGAYKFYHGALFVQVSDLFDRITGVYMEQIAYPGERYQFENIAADHSLLFVFLAFLFSSYMGSAITSRAGRLALALVGGLPFTFACLAVNRHPSILAVVGLVLFFFLLAAGSSHYGEESNSFRAVLCSLLPLALLLGALVLIVRPSQYQYDPESAQLSRELKKLSETLDNWISERASAIVLPHTETSVEHEEAEQPEPTGVGQEAETSGTVWQSGVGTLDLTRGFDEEALSEIYMTLRPSESGTLYLRAISYGDYIGTGWQAAQEPSALSSLAFTAQALEAAGGERQELGVRVLVGAPYRYLPYFSTESEQNDSFVPAASSAYSLRFYSFPESFDTLTLPASLSESEAAYRAFAHAVYTRLPLGTRDALLVLAQQAGLTADSPDLISQVARYVQYNAVYDLHTAPYPSGDYALYFLTEAKQGYCIHYATAATALYRALGVPARITEGFLVAAEAGRSLEVTGENAHAWVEVYRDGLGWLPVEVTGQSGLRSDALGAGTEEMRPLSAEPSTEPVGPDGSPLPEDAVPAQPEEAEGRPVGLVTQSLQEELSDQAGLSTQKRSLWLPVLLLLLLLLALFPAWRAFRRLLRRYALEQADRKKAAVAIYEAAQTASAFGQSVPDVIRCCAEKAVFSSHPVRAEELAESRKALEEMLNGLYSTLNPWNRFRFKFFYGLR